MHFVFFYRNGNSVILNVILSVIYSCYTSTNLYGNYVVYVKGKGGENYEV